MASGTGPVSLVPPSSKGSKSKLAKSPEVANEEARAGDIQVRLPYTARVRFFRYFLGDVTLWPGPGKNIPDSHKEFATLVQYPHLYLGNLNNIREQLRNNPKVTRRIVEEQPNDMLEILAQTVRVVLPPDACRQTLIALACDRNFWGDTLGDPLLQLAGVADESRREGGMTPPPPAHEPPSTTPPAMQPRTLAFISPAGGRWGGNSVEGVPGLVNGLGGESGGRGGEGDVATNFIYGMLRGVSERYGRMQKEREGQEAEMDLVKGLLSEAVRREECFRAALKGAERDMKEAEAEVGALKRRAEGVEKGVLRGMELEIEMAEMQTKLEEFLDSEQLNLPIPQEKKRARMG